MSKINRCEFHPLEIALCGYSGSGKTTLIENIIKILSQKYKIGFIKHDAHRFEMDKEGKDTWKAYNSGADQIFIHNDEKWAQLGKTNNLFEVRPSLSNLDFVLVEGHKKTNIPKLIVLGEGQTQADILKDYDQGNLQNVLGFVTPDKNIDLNNTLPFFQRNDYQSISNFIEGYFKEKINKTPIYGLVLSGGQSKRMGKDKGTLNYHGKPQSAYMADQLNSICEKTFLSCRENQVNEEHLQLYPQIHDAFLNIGPMGGILSAFQKHPQTAWLVMACDLPFVDEDMLKQLVGQRNPFKMATCFVNPDKGWAEPLCTIYEPKAFARFLQFYAQGYSCPRKMLMNSSIETVQVNNIRGLENANTSEDYKKIKELI